MTNAQVYNNKESRSITTTSVGNSQAIQIVAYSIIISHSNCAISGKWIFAKICITQTLVGIFKADGCKKTKNAE